MILAVLLLLCTGAFFLLRPIYIHAQQDKITTRLIQAFDEESTTPVFVEPLKLALEDEEMDGSPLWNTVEYAPNGTVKLSAVAKIVIEKLSLELPIVEGTDNVHLRYAIGREQADERRILVLYGRRLEKGSRLFSSIDTLQPADAVTIIFPEGEMNYQVIKNEVISKEELSSWLAAADRGETVHILLVTGIPGEEGKLLLVEGRLAEKEEPSATPTPTPVMTSTPSPTATTASTPTPSPSPTPKPTKRPVRNTPTPEPTAEPTATPTPNDGFGSFNTPEIALPTPAPTIPVSEPPEIAEPTPETAAPTSPHPSAGGFGNETSAGENNGGQA